MTREQKIYQEAAALWRELYGAPPPPGMDGGALLQMITSGSRPATYSQLCNPHLRNVVRRV